MALYGGSQLHNAPVGKHELIPLPVVFGPGATLWYRILNKINLSSKQSTILSRVAVDQVVFTPVNLTLFLSSMAFLEGWPTPAKPKITGIPRSASDASEDIHAIADEARAELAVAEKGAKERISDKLNSTYWMALTRNWMLWPWVQLVNFSFVPLNHRVLVVNVVSLGWNCYLSYLNSGGGAETESDETSKKAS